MRLVTRCFLADRINRHVWRLNQNMTWARQLAEVPLAA